MSAPGPRRPALGVTLLGLALALGCAAHAKVTNVAERTYAVECKASLAVCLVPVQEICQAHGYDVLSATERRDTSGATPEYQVFVKAKATVRCREAVPVFGKDPNPAVPAPASAAPVPAPAPPAPAAPAPAS